MGFQVYNVMPIPPDDAITRYVEAGPLRVGVELRHLDEAELDAAYGDDPAAQAEIDANKPAAGVEDEGVSIHVFGDDGREYLRFDMFEAGPHYHYIAHARAENVIVDYDPTALGDMLEWSLERLRSRLPEMLERAAAPAYAAALDSGTWSRCVEEVGRLAREARAKLASL